MWTCRSNTPCFFLLLFFSINYNLFAGIIFVSNCIILCRLFFSLVFLVCLHFLLIFFPPLCCNTLSLFSQPSHSLCQSHSGISHISSFDLLLSGLFTFLVPSLSLFPIPCVSSPLLSLFHIPFSYM